MNLTINIDSTDRTDVVQLVSLKIIDNINQQVDTASFSIRTTPDQTFTPATGSEVQILDGATVLFGGIITEVDENYELPGMLRYDVQCKDYTQLLDRELVTNRYTNTTANAVISDIITNYTSGFTDTNVAAGFPVESVTFNRISVSQALQKLADLSGYSWYVDYDKDIHFFPSDTNAAPFELTDSSNNFIPSSLVLKNDFTQIRNRVFVRGGEAAGVSRTETFDGDGSKLTFTLANKYQSMPTVTVGGTAVTVGVDFIDAEADYDAFWNYTQKYVRFKSSTVPASGTNNVSVTGIPLFPIVAQVEDKASIDAHGVYEFALIDNTITSRTEARNYAAAQLLAYAQDVVEGSFRTYTSGLRSGQQLHITARSRDDYFLIQSVTLTMVTNDEGHWEVQIATLRTMGIIRFLISLLQNGDRQVANSDTEVLDKANFVTEEMIMTDTVAVSKVHNPQNETMTMTDSVNVQALDFPVIFVAGPYTPDPTNTSDYKRVFITDGSKLG